MQFDPKSRVRPSDHPMAAPVVCGLSGFPRIYSFQNILRRGALNVRRGWSADFPFPRLPSVLINASDEMESSFEKSKGFCAFEDLEGRRVIKDERFLQIGTRSFTAQISRDSDSNGTRNSLRAKQPTEKPKTGRLKEAKETKQAMEVQGSHSVLSCRQPSRKQDSSHRSVDPEGGSKKVSFEKRQDGGKGTKKSSMVITLPAKSEKLATKGTQTDFRDSEAQTFPWKHEIRAGGEALAELLSMDWFSLEKNFPPGVEEVSLIEKARQKLAWENIVVRLRGKETESRRRSLVLRMAASDAAWREMKKDEENRRRMEMSIREMKEARRAFEENLTMRLQRSYRCRRRENRAKIDYWKHQLRRNIRKVKSGKERSATKRDIIAMHEDRTSDLYAPKLRDGENPSLGHEVIDIRCRYLKRFHGLEILEKHMCDVLRLKLSKFEPSKPKPRKAEQPLNKLIEKAVEEPQERKIGGLSLKVAIPAPPPESPAKSTRPPSDSE